jgi:hypothetical protein
MTHAVSAPADHCRPAFNRRRALQTLFVLPLTAASLSLAGCADIRAPRSAVRPKSYIRGHGGQGGKSGGGGGQ